MLERHELEAFLTLAEELHFGRTAERLHVSTARISQTIAKLERRIGVPLFHRTSRRVELSPLGRQLYEEVRPAWSRITDAVERAVYAGRGVTGVLKVAFTGPATGQLLIGATQAFRVRHPECEVRIREARPSDVLPWLRAGEVDLALAGHPVPGEDLATGPVLVREARMVAVPTGHPFARRENIALADLARVTVLQDPETPGEAALTYNEVLTLVGAGEGVFVVGAHVRRYFARPDVVYVPVADAEPVEWGLVWLAEGATARVRAFGEAALGLVA
ncbi:LysR family transcriptional regulator [Streptomyces sp. NPDC101160]|uniref:LysR family transcriptional regulator n=1 Tax=Streptomyces sp. NPDC101160 TaxID=3366118 RepID=UPI0038215B89